MSGRSLRIAMFGLGYVGTTTAACLLRDGHEVVGIDVNPEKLDSLAHGRSPVLEPGIDALLAAGHAAGRLHAASRIEPWLDGLDMAMICVGTPSRADGRLELTQLLEVTRQLGQALPRRRGSGPLLLVFRSTVLPGTMEGILLPALEAVAGIAPGAAYEVAFNPEFLRESTALEDHYAPPRIVIGERHPGLTGRLLGIYDHIVAPVFEVPFAIAETVKLVDNSFHALKVAFGNEVGRVCQSQGLDPQAVFDVFLADTKLNVSPAYLRPGGPYGGSCLPKDLGAMIALAQEHGIAAPLLAGVRDSNRAHLEHIVQAVRQAAPPPGPVVQLGLSFKAGTDDLRNSPLVDLAEELARAGYDLRIVDPDVDPSRLLGSNFARAVEHRDTVLRRITADPAEAAKGAALVILGKPLPAVRAALPSGLPTLDIVRLRAPAG